MKSPSAVLCTDMKTRNPQLDVLRGIAVIAVVGHHHAYYPLWFRVGRFGVDLFFVLSGFLISGLLFAEYKSTNSINFGRFFVRRGFKIYPAYFFFLLFFLPFTFRFLHWSDWVFMQSYFPGFWGHGWTLSVEEHFYLALPLILIISSKLFPKSQFAWIPFALPLIMTFCLAMRIKAGPNATDLQDLNPTHVRMDTLFAGVTLGWLYHFRRERFVALKGYWMLVLGLLFLAPNFLNLSTYWGYTAGLTANLLGFSCLLVWALNTPWVAKLEGLALVGYYSYSIYLWHWPIAILFQKLAPNSLLAFWTYIAVAIAVGVAAANLVEFPFLRFRDKYFPSVQRSCSLPSAVAPRARLIQA